MEEYFALRRLAGTSGATELLASFHDSRYFYIAMVGVHFLVSPTLRLTGLVLEILPRRGSSITVR